jgi:hypothetical protein
LATCATPTARRPSDRPPCTLGAASFYSGCAWGCGVLFWPFLLWKREGTCSTGDAKAFFLIRRAAEPAAHAAMRCHPTGWPRLGPAAAGYGDEWIRPRARFWKIVDSCTLAGAQGWTCAAGQ